MKQCRRADEPLSTFTLIEPSAFEHDGARTAASQSEFLPRIYSPIISAELLTVGSYYPGNVKTEMYLTNVGQWITVGDFPSDCESESTFEYKKSF